MSPLGRPIVPLPRFSHAPCLVCLDSSSHSAVQCSAVQSATLRAHRHQTALSDQRNAPRRPLPPPSADQMAQCDWGVATAAAAAATDFASPSASISTPTPGILALDSVIDPASLYRQALWLRWEPQLPERVRPNAAAAVHFLLQSRLRELESPHPPAAAVQGDGRVEAPQLADQIETLRRAAAALQRNINSLDAWDVLSELDIWGNHVSDAVMREALGQSDGATHGPADGAGATHMQEAADAGAEAEAQADPGASDSSVEDQRNSAATISTINSIRAAFAHPPMQPRGSIQQ